MSGFFIPWPGRARAAGLILLLWVGSTAGQVPDPYEERDEERDPCTKCVERTVAIRDHNTRCEGETDSSRLVGGHCLLVATMEILTAYLSDNEADRQAATKYRWRMRERTKNGDEILAAAESAWRTELWWAYRYWFDEMAQWVFFGQRDLLDPDDNLGRRDWELSNRRNALIRCGAIRPESDGFPVPDSLLLRWAKAWTDTTRLEYRRNAYRNQDAYLRERLVNIYLVRLAALAADRGRPPLVNAAEAIETANIALRTTSVRTGFANPRQLLEPWVPTGEENRRWCGHAQFARSNAMSTRKNANLEEISADTTLRWLWNLSEYLVSMEDYVQSLPARQSWAADGLNVATNYFAANLEHSGSTLRSLRLMEEWDIRSLRLMEEWDRRAERTGVSGSDRSPQLAKSLWGVLNSELDYIASNSLGSKFSKDAARSLVGRLETCDDVTPSGRAAVELAEVIIGARSNYGSAVREFLRNRQEGSVDDGPLALWRERLLPGSASEREDQR